MFLGRPYPPVSVTCTSPELRYLGSFTFTTSSTASLKDVKYSAGSRSNLRRKFTLLGETYVENIFRRCILPSCERRFELPQNVKVDSQTPFLALDELLYEFIVVRSSMLPVEKLSKPAFQVSLVLIHGLHPQPRRWWVTLLLVCRFQKSDLMRRLRDTCAY